MLSSLAMAALWLSAGVGGGSVETGDIYLSLQAEQQWLLACVKNGYPLTRDMQARLHELLQAPLQIFDVASGRDRPMWLVGWDEEGFNATLPHIGPIMHGSRCALGRGVAAGAHGDAMALAADVARCVKAAGHVSTSPALITSLISMSIARRAAETAQAAVDRGQVTPEAAAAMARSLRTSGSSEHSGIDGSPFGLGAAIGQERAVVSGWMARTLELDEGTDDDPVSPTALGVARDVLGGMSAAGLTKGMLRAELARMDAYYAELEQIAEMSNHAAADRRVTALEAKVERAGGLASVLMPAMSRVLERRQETLEEIRGVAAALDHVATGQLPQSANAAWWWIRAGSAARVCAGPWHDDPEVAAAVDALLAAADALQSAAYPEPIEGYVEPIIPWWLPDQDLLAQGLLARVKASVQRGDTPAAAHDLERLIRMTATMGNAKAIAPSLTALSLAERFTPLVEQTAPLMATSTRVDLERWVRTISTRDPLGIRSAASSTRARLNDVIPMWYPDTTLLMDVPADEAGLLSMIAWLRGRATASRGIFIAPGGDSADSPLASLDDVRLDAWSDVGAANERPVGFSELGGEDYEAASMAAAALLSRLRATLSR